MPDDLYIGYRDRAPRKLARGIAVTAAILLVVTSAIGMVLARSQDPFAEATFEFGTIRSYTGWMETGAVPTLTVLSDGHTIEENYVLVSGGKHGASYDPASVNPESPGRSFVKLEGALIHRGDVRMIEVAEGSIQPVPEPAPPMPGKMKLLGAVTLRGEIVDSKCYLGVMKPGEKTVHRACARLCIRGGIPPMLVIRQPDGTEENIFLTDADGGSVNVDVLPFVATPVSVSGLLYGGRALQVMRIDVASLVLLD